MLKNSLKVAQAKSESGSNDGDLEVDVEEADHEKSLQNAYNELCEEVFKLKKLNKKLYNKLIVVEHEKNNLFQTLEVFEFEISRLKIQKDAVDKDL